MKNLMMFLVLTTTFNAMAALQEGTFRGRWNNKRERVEIMLKTAQGREGSFLAILNKGDEKISVYVVDPVSAGRYTLTPFSVSDDGEISIVNDNPSLVLVESQAVGWRDEVNYRITSANSDNQSGVNGFMTLTERVTKKNWIELEPGTYKLDRRNRNALTISMFDELEGQSDAIFATTDLNGAFIIREKLPLLFSINVNASLGSGDRTEVNPRKIGFFVKTRRKVDFILVDPENDENITTFRLR